MTRRIDMTGRRYGRVTVLEFAGLAEVSGAARWKCRCDCGTVFITNGYALRGGACRSCGCLRAESSRSRASIASSAWRVPVVILAPDGIRHLFASLTEAAAWMSCTPATIARHAYQGKPFHGHQIDKMI